MTLWEGGMSTFTISAFGIPESGLLQKETLKGCGLASLSQTYPSCFLAKEKDVTSEHASDPWTKWNSMKHRLSQTAGSAWGPRGSREGF